MFEIITFKHTVTAEDGIEPEFKFTCTKDYADHFQCKDPFIVGKYEVAGAVALEIQVECEGTDEEGNDIYLLKERYYVPRNN